MSKKENNKEDSEKEDNITDPTNIDPEALKAREESSKAVETEKVEPKKVDVKKAEEPKKQEEVKKASPPKAVLRGREKISKVEFNKLVSGIKSEGKKLFEASAKKFALEYFRYDENGETGIAYRNKISNTIIKLKDK